MEFHYKGNTLSGVPSGGETGQILTKKSTDDYDVEWANSYGGSSIPRGLIAIWSGSADDVPKGWHICDGEYGTPDLRGRFVLGASEHHEVGEDGGEETVTLTVDQMPSHSHLVKRGTYMVDSGSNSNVYRYSSDQGQLTDEVGGNQPHNNMPPYYVLCYIMKVDEQKPQTDAKIYGAQWDGTSRTDWTRTDDAEGFSNPDPFVNDGQHPGSSPFDDILPWSGMKVETHDCGEVVAIPKFYYKLEQTANNGMKIQISMTKHEGFSTSPAHMDRDDGRGERDVVYVGRYHCAYAPNYYYKSVTGQNPGVNQERNTFRVNIHYNLGDNVWQWDYATRFTIQLLYLVEFADWNSQEKIGYGCGNGTSTENMGLSDTMGYHTGTMQTSRDTYGVGVQYRNIEGLWDNVFDFVDGCYNDSNGLNIILNPNKFSDTEGGVSVGIPSNGFPSKFSVNSNAPFPMFYPTESNGSNETYSCDAWGFDAKNQALYSGSYYLHSTNNGLFYTHGNEKSGQAGIIGSRLMELP